MFLRLSKAVHKLFLKKTSTNKSYENVLIIGAGVAGKKLLLDIIERNKKQRTKKTNVIGFIDDNKKKINQLILGKKVIGTVNDVIKISNNYNISSVCIAIPSASGEKIEKILRCLSGLNVKKIIIPRSDYLLDSEFCFNKLKSVSIEDILNKKKFKVDYEEIGSEIRNKVILVTGGGGTIGAELCRHLVKLLPKKILILDVSEFNIYNIRKSLKKFTNSDQIKIEFILDDIKSKACVEKILFNHKPNIVFHVAAYKHVSLVENNPLAGIRVNIMGTMNVAQASVKNDVDKFILISSDKAAEPENIMGVTKRISELICLKLNEKNYKTLFSSVRFGNVFGSSGSVVNLFTEQAIKREPLTVTHPDMARYFMSIDDACKLILQSVCLLKGGEIFILSMDKPVKIVDLAEKVIEMAKYDGIHNLGIKFVGANRYEKLCERLVSNSEVKEETSHPMIFKAQNKRKVINLKIEISKLMSNISYHREYRLMEVEIKSILGNPLLGYADNDIDINENHTQI